MIPSPRRQQLVESLTLLILEELQTEISIPKGLKKLGQIALTTAALMGPMKAIGQTPDSTVTGTLSTSKFLVYTPPGKEFEVNIDTLKNIEISKAGSATTDTVLNSLLSHENKAKALINILSQFHSNDVLSDVYSNEGINSYVVKLIKDILKEGGGNLFLSADKKFVFYGIPEQGLLIYMGEYSPKSSINEKSRRYP